MTLVVVAVVAVLLVWSSEFFRRGALADEVEIQTDGQDQPDWGCCVWFFAIAGAVVCVLIWATLATVFPKGL